MTVTIKKSDFDLILKHSKDNLPEEACGLIAGTISENKKNIEKVYLLENIDHSNEHFTIDLKEHLAALKDARANGLEILGNWHSHPESPSRQSQEDIRLAVDSTASYLILSLENAEKPVLNSFSTIQGESIKENLILLEE